MPKETLQTIAKETLQKIEKRAKKQKKNDEHPSRETYRQWWMTATATLEAIDAACEIAEGQPYVNVDQFICVIRAIARSQV